MFQGLGACLADASQPAEHESLELAPKRVVRSRLSIRHRPPSSLCAQLAFADQVAQVASGSAYEDRGSVEGEIQVR